MAIFSKLAELLTGKSSTNTSRPFKALTERSLIELESKIGSQLFGDIPAGHRRDFFCLDKNTWVWHEEWVDAETGKKMMSTTRYEIHSNGILKAQDGLNYRFIEGEELVNLTLAINLYYEQVMRGVYKTDPYTGRPLETASPATM